MRNKYIKYTTSDTNIRSCISWILCIIIPICLTLLVRTYVFEFTRVSGDSMCPTLETKQLLGVEKISRYFDLPERGDIVIVHYPNEKSACVKRCIGLPGDTVEIKGNTVYLNNEPLSEDYISSADYPDMKPIVVADENIFVMGDNRVISKDSRHVGTIPKENIVGNAIFSIWPISKAAII